MDSFLFYGDYAKQIQSENLQQIIGGNQSVLDAIQKAAVEECVSYLKQKYDISQALQITPQHNKTQTYKAGQTVYLNAIVYSATSTYALGALVLQAGNVYKCTTAITVAEAFTAAKWGLIGAQYTTYYALFPNQIFNYLAVYSVGSQVFWKNKVYTCRIATQILDHEALLQIGRAESEQIVNVFPDDPIKGVQYWGAGVPYSVPANTEISNATYWTQGDSRDQKLLTICIDIALYHAHSRISPRNIPEFRAHRYIGLPEDRISLAGRIIYPTYSALGWLQAAATGLDITPNLPTIQPKAGQRIRFGGNMKNQNIY